MTVKTNEVIVDALEEIITQAEEAPIEPADGRTAIRVLNDMMNAWAARGINLGYTNVSDTADPITVPLGALEGIKASLALRLASRFNVPAPPELIQKAKNGMKAVLNLAIQTIPTEYPSTLPRGSGNAYPGYDNTPFYADQQSTILTETGGSIALEDDTEEA
jgi:hypothetical protein